MIIPKPIGWILWKLNVCIRIIDEVDIKKYSTNFSPNMYYYNTSIEYKVKAHHYEFNEPIHIRDRLSIKLFRKICIIIIIVSIISLFL